MPSNSCRLHCACLLKHLFHIVIAKLPCLAAFGTMPAPKQAAALKSCKEEPTPKQEHDSPRSEAASSRGDWQDPEAWQKAAETVTRAAPVIKRETDKAPAKAKVEVKTEAAPELPPPPPPPVRPAARGSVKAELKAETKAETKVEPKTEPKAEPREMIADSIDERNKLLTEMWTSVLVNDGNTSIPVEDLVHVAYKDDIFTGESLELTRSHVTSQLSQNWELFDVRTKRGTKYVRVKESVYREARARSTEDSNVPIPVYRGPSGAASAPSRTASGSADATVIPESVESISAKQTQESAPKLQRLDERTITPQQFLAGLNQWNGKHYPKKVQGLNTNWSVEEVTNYMQNLPKDASGKIRSASPFHPSEYPVHDSIYDFVKSLQLSCSGPDNAFGFPDCSINVLQSLTAGLHVLTPGNSIWIQNRLKPPADMAKRTVYFHSLPPSRLLEVCRHGLAPCLGAGYQTLETAYGQPVLGAYVAKLGYALHYPISDCTKSDPVPEDRNGISGSQFLASDGTAPLRCLLVLYGIPTINCGTGQTRPCFQQA